MFALCSSYVCVCACVYVRACMCARVCVAVEFPTGPQEMLHVQYLLCFFYFSPASVSYLFREADD